MDPPYVPHHHHPRYVPYSPAPPPLPPPAPFESSPSFFASCHHLPPPPPPPQQHLSYQPSLPQPSPQHHAPYNPHHPQITYNSSFNVNPQFSDFSHRSAPESPHAGRRVPELETRLDYWSGNRQPWEQPASNSDRDSHYTQLDGKPASPVNRYRHGYEGSSRFRNEYSEGFKLGYGERDDFVRLQDDYGVRDRSSGDFGISSSKYESGLGKGDGRYDSSFDRQVIRGGTTDKFRESARWAHHDRQTLDGNEINNRDGMRIGSRKYDFQGSKVEFYDNKGRREDIYEVNRSPRKQIQKKSALLRIQLAKPNYRSREDERSHYSGYSSEMRSNSVRGKDQAVHSEDRMDADEREGSPVELDVSFKSNSLVAKAITPPCSSAVASDTNSTPKNSKVRKFLEADKITSAVSPFHSDTGSTPRSSKIRNIKEIEKQRSSSPQRVNEAAAVVYNLQCPEKNINHSEGKATSSATGTLENITSKPCPEKVKFSLKLNKNKRPQKAAAPSERFSRAPVSHEDANRSEKIDASSRSCDAEINVRTQPSSGVFNAAGTESIEGRPKTSVSTKADAKVGKTSARSAISDSINENSGKTLRKNSISDKIVPIVCKTSAKSTVSNEVGKVSPDKAVMDKFANNQGKGSTKSINLVKPDSKADKTSSRSTLSDKVVSHPVKAPIENVISGNKDDNTRKTPFRSTTSGCVDAHPGKTSSVKIVKKKKIVRKVVKKVTNKALCLENAKVGQNSDKFLCADSSPQSLAAAHKSVMPVKKRIFSANLHTDGSPVHHVSLQDPSKDATLLLNSKVEDNSLKGMVLKEVGSDFNFVGQPESVIHKKRKFLESVICLPNIEGKLDGNLTIADNSIPRPETLTPVQDATEAASEIVCSSVCMPTFGQLHTAVNISGDYDTCLSDSEKIKCGSVSGFGLCNAEEIHKFDEISLVIGTSNQTSVDIHCQVTDGVSTEAFTVRTTNLLNSEEAEVSRIAVPADRIIDGGLGAAVVTEIDPVDLGRVGVDSKLGDGSCGLLSKDGIVVFKEASGRTGSSNAISSTEDQEENASTDKERKRKIELPMVKFPSSQSHGISLGTGAVASSEKSLDVAIGLSDENLHPVEKAGFLDGRSPIESLSDVKMNGQSGVEQCDADSLPVTKKQKLSTSSSSPTVSLISEMPAVDQIPETDAQPQTSTIDDLMHTSEDVKVSKLNARCSAANHSPVNVCSDNLDLETPCLLSHSPSRSVCDVSSLPASSQNNHRIESADVEVVDTERVHLEATDTGFVDVTRCRIASPHQSVGLDERLTNAEDSESSSVSKSLGSVAHGNSISTTSMVETLAPASDQKLNEYSPVNKDGSLMCALYDKESPGQNSQPYVCRDLKLPNQKSQSHGACSVSASMPYSDIAKAKTGPLPPHVSKYSFSASGQLPGRRNQITHPAPKSYPGRNVFVASRNTTASNNTSKSRTWHRADNSHMPVSNKPSLNKVPPQTPMSYKVAKAETSYIRKGNSLVRKAFPVPAPHQETQSLGSAVSQLSSMVLNEVGKVSGTESDVLDSANSSRTVLADASTGVTLSSTMPGEISSANRPNDSSVNSTSGLVMEAPLIVSSGSGSRADLSSSVEIIDIVESFKGRTSTSGTTLEIHSVSNMESPCEQNERTMTSSNANNMRYIKLRSDQLVAADASAHIADNNQSGKPDGYYKRSKNQLIRTSMEGNVKWSASAQSKKVNAAREMATGTFGNRQPHRAMGKIHKLSRFSLVWTLKNTRLSSSVGQSCYPKIFPQLFPWKRVSYWRSMLTSGYNRNSNLSSIGHKLLLLRKRNTVYTRSNNGFSLRKSKVLSVGGSSLKWSKSIERRSKKASEEATLAVAEAERKRKEQNTTACSTLMPNSGGHSSCRVVHGTQLHRRERIFRIGSMRYKMDSSRRTLQRIPDDITSSTDVAAGNKANKSYVPRRLVIGNDEYVRIGSGNQLIRNPKKRTRVLASEKVRWSLHTARQRLVKRRKYCQFFTRFGKCNKDNGKCPYIHDPSKIAVCTKFLKGLCSNPICKLTHKVLPERMPDCSYFLQGLCTKEICPYRHVHVNPNASTCEAFLRGYCADGNECRKKHSYVCPAFEATGSCPQGSKCKLHHPKKRIKEKRSKSSRERKNTQGRYFGSVHMDISEPMKTVSGRHVTGDKDESEVEEELGDFISINVSDDEDWKIYDAATEQGTFVVENGTLDLESEDIDELILPVRIMDKNLLT